MPKASPWALALLALAACGCGLTVQHHVVAAPVYPCAVLRSATVDELVASYNRNADAVHTLRLDFKLLTKTGGRKTKIESINPEVDNTHLLLEKPSLLRFYGAKSAALASVKAFDLASDGSMFRLSIPLKDEVFEGPNDYVPDKVGNELERLRPQVIIDALLTNPIPMGEASEAIPLNERAETAAAVYSVLLIDRGLDNRARGSRRLFFSRCDLLPERQIFYDATGGIATDATYSHFIQVDGVYVPQLMTIDRPGEDYSLTFTVKPGGIRVNETYPAGTWQLDLPAGARLISVTPKN